MATRAADDVNDPDSPKKSSQQNHSPVYENAVYSYENTDDNVQWVKEWLRSCQGNDRIVVAVAGKAGVGKSTFVNKFLDLSGNDKAPTGALATAVTDDVRTYEGSVNGVSVCVIDTPGLHARNQSSDSLRRTIAKLTLLNDKEKVSTLFYVSSMAQRVDETDERIIATLNVAFGDDIWKYAIFILTYADNVDSQSELNGAVSSFRSELASITHLECDNITVVPTSKYPDIPQNWSKTLLIEIIKRCKERDIPSFLKIKGIVRDDRTREHLTINPTVIASGALLGAVVGGVIGGAIPSQSFRAMTRISTGARIGIAVGSTISSSSYTGIAEVFFYVRDRMKFEQVMEEVKEEMDREVD